MIKSILTVIIAMLIFVFLMLEMAKAGEVWDAFLAQQPAKIRHCFGCQEYRDSVPGKTDDTPLGNAPRAPLDNIGPYEAAPGSPINNGSPLGKEQ